jgi:PAS domain S-box-containing protein
MRILYVANERRTAQLAVGALRDVAPDVKLSWAGSLSGALRWVRDNRDLGALLVEADIDGQSSASFIGQVRALGVAAPIVVVASPGGAPVAALKAGADDYVANDESFLADLPAVLGAAVRRAHTRPCVSTTPVRLLYFGDAALARQCLTRRPSSIEIIEPARLPDGTLETIPSAPPADGSPSPFDVVVVEHDQPGVDAFGIVKAVARHQPQVPVVLVVACDDRLVVPALKLGAADCVVKTVDAFRTLFFRIDYGLLHSVRRDPLPPANESSAEAERPREHERLLQAAFDRERAQREELEAKLATTEEGRRDAERQLDADTRLSAALIAERRAEYETQLAAAVASRDALARKAADAEAALRHAEERHASESAAAAERFGQREAQLAATLAERAARHDEELTRAAAGREALAKQLRDTAARLDQARRGREADAAAVKLLTQRESELRAALQEATATVKTFELRLADADAALEYAEQYVSAERGAAAERQARAEADLARMVTAQTALEQRAASAEAARRNAEKRFASEIAKFKADLAEQQARNEAGMANAAAARDRLARELRDTAASLERAQSALVLADERAATERRTAAERQAQLEADHARQAAARKEIEQALRSAEAARREAEQRHRSELSGTAASLERAQSALAVAEQRGAAERRTAAERQARLEADLAQKTAAHDAVEQALRSAEAAHREAEQRYASELRDTAQSLERAQSALADAEQRAAAERRTAAERQARLESDLAQKAAAHDALEQALRSAEAAHRESEQRYESELATAAARFAERCARYDADLAKAAALRETLAQQLSEATGALERTQRDLAAAVEAIKEGSRRETDLVARLEEATRSLRAAESRLHDLDAMLRRAEEQGAAERLEAAARYAALEERLDQQIAANERLQEDLAATRLAGEADHQRLSAESAALQHTLDRVRADAAETLECVSNAHTEERNRLETLVGERDAQLKEQTASHQVSQQAAEHALAQIEDRLRTTLETSRREIAELQRELASRAGDLETAKNQRDALQIQADRIPELRRQIEERDVENRRRFVHAPYGIFQCRRDGTLGHVNHALVRLLGYRTADDLRSIDFATRVFESAEDLRGLTERCLVGRRMESIETRWRRKDGRRVAVRLLGVPIAAESVEIMAEDITDVRAIEDRLRQAQRMEAVGRLASEVATTCDSLLRDVTQRCQHWLAAVASDAALRYQGELLLDDVTRAAGLLQQLTAYSNKQASAVQPVSVNRVLRDLAPVLKRVAGDEVEFVLPKTSPQVNVDVEPERLERVLVNVASVARQRMPHGGQLKIDLASVEVDHQFVSKYPDVRPGAHALITVTEVKSAAQSTAALELASGTAGADARRSGSGKTGVDFGALFGLVKNSGGHLWMKAEPAGNMLLKIHLPQPASGDRTRPALPIERADRRPAIARLFGH